MSSLRTLTTRNFPRKIFTDFHQRTVTTARCFSLHKLTEEQLMLQKTCRDFADSELKPIAAQLDREHKFPAEQIKQLGQMGLLSIAVAEKWGGAGLDILTMAVAVEEISRGCGGTGAIVSIHNCLYANLLDTVGTDEQKKIFLEPFVANGDLGCCAISEPEAGSDVGSMTTTAVDCGDHYVLNGTKTWCSSGYEAKAGVIFGTVDKQKKHKGLTAFLIPMPTPGLSLGKKEDKLGIRACSTCNLILEDVKIPKSYVLGQPGDGFKIAMSQLDKARVGIAAQAVGIAQAALEVAVDYAAQRKAFGHPINEFQGVKFRLAEMATRLEAARLMVWRAAVLCNEPQRTTKESSMAKWMASEVSTLVTHNAIQILGGMGYVSDMPAERHYRDARITEIYGGVNDIHKLVIGDAIIKEYQL